MVTKNDLMSRAKILFSYLGICRQNCSCRRVAFLKRRDQCYVKNVS